MGVIALLYCWMRRFAAQLALAAFPITVVVAYNTFPTLFTLCSAESQSYSLPALQTVEFTGVHGLDCVSVLVNNLY